MKMILIAIALVLQISTAISAEVQVAAAANFSSALEKISKEFTAESGHKLLVSYGSTGKLYAQIINGAPFEVFLAADEEHPKKLVTENMAVKDSVFTYAIGKLVLWSPKEKIVDPKGEVLTKMEYKHLAIANPKLAPYGKAAQEVLEKMGLWEKLQQKLVLGENINQAHQFVESGNAELGFVAYSQIIKDRKPMGPFWTVPQELYSPLKQNALLLKDTVGARAFLKFLKTARARAIIKEFGYE